MDSLERLRRIASRALTGLLWLHVLLNPAIAAVTGGDWITILLISGLLAATATGCLALNAPAKTTHATIAVALVGTVSMLLVAMARTPWQVDIHMYYFAGLALLATLCDWRAVLAATAATAVHHLVLNFLFPALIYPGGPDIVRVAMHAAILLVEAGALVWLTMQINTLFAKSTASVAEAQAALLRADLLTAASVKEQATRDRRQAAMDTHTQEFGASVSGVMAILGEAASKMHLAADEMSEAAIRTRDSTSNAVEGANASARDLNSVAVAAEQMAASINEISRQVAHVTTAVQKAVERASETDTKVASLATAADRIGDVVRLISDIAGQTNLLALNATIEAARAGEAGKGFAVVASEVKALAAQTARATGQIGTQIVAIREATSEAVGAVRDVGDAIGQVEAVATAIAAAVEQQAAATQEISSSVQSVTMATTTAAQAMEEVLTIAEQTDTASRSVLIAAEAVGNTADTLRVEVSDFLSAMKRADGDDRRAYERVPGNGAIVSLSIRGGAEAQAIVHDISRGGIGLTCGSTAPSGTEAKIGLPTGGSVSARVVRSENGLLTMTFHQDAATRALLDRALAALHLGPQAAAS
jgi:methyl-accepting chemotaxis protein